jgi:hypothetical protein
MGYQGMAIPSKMDNSFPTYYCVRNILPFSNLPYYSDQMDVVD